MYKIAITGPESTGKSFLAEELAKHYTCNWVPEFARAYLTKRNGEYEQEDLAEILEGQISSEKKAEAIKNKFLFCDTDPLVLLIWSKVKYKNVDNVIEDAWKNHNYDFHLLLYPDLEWEYDPLRENKDDRLALFSHYITELESTKNPFVVIKGNEEERLKNAIKAIEDFFN